METGLIPTVGNRPALRIIGSVTFYVGVHDKMYLAERKLWKQRLSTAHPDHEGGTAVRFRNANKMYQSWLSSEKAWYATLDMEPPTEIEGMSKQRVVIDIPCSMDNVYRMVLTATLKLTDWNAVEAGRLLNMTSRMLRYKMKQLGIRRPGETKRVYVKVGKTALIAALEDAQWRYSRAAMTLGVSSRVVEYRVKKYGIRRPGADVLPVPDRPVILEGQTV